MMRRYIAEFIGTFALLFFGCGARDMVGDTNDFAGILLVHLTFGLTIAAMIYMFSYLSSAHFNPAITFSFALARRFPWRYVLPYWLAQFLGAILAIACHALFIPDHAVAAHYGATIPKISIVPSLGIELILTFFLMMVSMGSATDKRFKRASSGLTIGFTIIISGLMANSLSGASMNPARSLAPALFAGGEALAISWLYIIAPLCGAALGALIYEILRGSEENAKPVLEELPVKKAESIKNPEIA
jgi:MIP family channel proteins